MVLDQPKMSPSWEIVIILPIWQLSWKTQLIGKDSDAGRDWAQEEKGTTKDEMAGWHHILDGCESEWTQGVGDGQGCLVCCDSWGCKESDTTKRLNWLTPIMKKTHFGGVSSRRSCRSSQNRSISASSTLLVGAKTDYCGIEWFASETNRNHSVILHPSTAFWTLCWVWRLLHISKEYFTHSSLF